MIGTSNSIIRLLKSKWDIIIPENISVVTVDFSYNWKLPSATTELYSIKRDGDTLIVRFSTSFGIFHQAKIDYDDTLVVLHENVNGTLKSLWHDLVISSLTYPNTTSRRSVSCGQ